MEHVIRLERSGKHKMAALRFDGRVALITGAGGGMMRVHVQSRDYFAHILQLMTYSYNRSSVDFFSLLVGLGREYALLLASRGASIVGMFNLHLYDC